jgi:hypothetical protein
MRDQAAVVAELDDVDAVNLDSVDLRLKLQDYATVVSPLVCESKIRPPQYLHCAAQILKGEFPTHLRRVCNGTLEHHVGVKRSAQQGPRRES